MSPPRRSTIARTQVIGIAASLSAMMPFATDVYLIVMPAIAVALAASQAEVHQTMAVFALGFGVAHLFVGSLADRYGRRPVVLGGLVLFVLASFIVMLAADLAALGIARFLQGLSIATCPILSRAIVRDAVPAHDVARTFALSNALASAAPMTAPFVGALAAAWGGWRAAMGLLIAFGVVLGVVLWAKLPETRPATAARAMSPLAAAGQILTHREFLLASACSGLIYSALFTWLTTSPFLMIDGLGFSTGAAATVLGFASAGYMAGSLGSARLSARHASKHLVLMGAGLMLAGSASTLAVLALTSPGPLVLLAGVLPFYIGLGIAHANALQLVMRPFGEMAGQASAWLGLVQQLSGVVISTAAVAFGGGIVAVWAMIGCCAALMVVAVVIARVKDHE